MIITISEDKIIRVSPVPFAEVVEDLTGKYGIANALRDSQARGLRPLTSPQLLDLRLDCPNIKDPLWSNWYTAASGVYVVEDSIYVVHGTKHPLTSHERVRNAVDEGLVNYGARLTPEESELFKTRKIEGLKDYDSFLRETKDKDLTDEQFGVVIKASMLKDLSNDYIKLSKWAKDPRAVMLAGGKRKAEVYAEFLDKKKIEEPYLELEAEPDNADRGRLVLVDSDNNNYGFDGNDNLDSGGRFVVVVPEAQVGVAQKNGASDTSLEARVERLDTKRIRVGDNIYRLEE